MAQSWDDPMRLQNQNTADIKCIIDNAELRAASTIFSNDQYRSEPYLQNAIWIKEGNFTLCLTLEREDTVNLINLLNQHLENIKANEFELIALNTKAAA
jgi:uncharacterized protein YaaQ